MRGCAGRYRPGFADACLAEVLLVEAPLPEPVLPELAVEVAFVVAAVCDLARFAVEVFAAASLGTMPAYVKQIAEIVQMQKNRFLITSVARYKS